MRSLGCRVQGSKEKVTSPIPKSALSFCFYYSFFFLLVHIAFLHGLLFEKNPLCSKESLKTIDLDLISLLSMSTSRDLLTNVF